MTTRRWLEQWLLLKCQLSATHSSPVFSESGRPGQWGQVAGGEAGRQQGTEPRGPSAVFPAAGPRQESQRGGGAGRPAPADKGKGTCPLALLPWTWVPPQTVVIADPVIWRRICSHEMKRCLLLGRKAMANLDNVLKKQRYHFANRGLCSQSYGFSSSHVRAGP